MKVEECGISIDLKCGNIAYKRMDALFSYT